MNKQIQELLKEKDFEGALETLKQSNTNARLVLGDYLNEKKLWNQKYITDESWQAYTGEVLVRIKQLCMEEEDNQELETKKGETEDDNKTASKADPKVFISYSSKDKPVVDKITTFLQEKYLDFFVDSISMIAGEMIEKTITEAIIARDYFVILLSRNSLQSSWVCLESTIGNMKTVTGSGWMIPVRLDESLEDIDFLASIPKTIRSEINKIDRHIEKSAKYALSHRYLDTNRQRYVDFSYNFDSMVDRYQKMLNISIAGDQFENGMKKLIQIITERKKIKAA